MLCPSRDAKEKWVLIVTEIQFQVQEKLTGKVISLWISCWESFEVIFPRDLS